MSLNQELVKSRYLLNLIQVIKVDKTKLLKHAPKSSIGKVKVPLELNYFGQVIKLTKKAASACLYIKTWQVKKSLTLKIRTYYIIVLN